MRKISEISVSVDGAVTVWFFVFFFFLVYFLAVCVGSMYSVDDHSTIGSGVDMVMLSVESGPSPCCHFCFRVAYITISESVSIHVHHGFYCSVVYKHTLVTCFPVPYKNHPALDWINGSVVEDYNVLLT